MAEITKKYLDYEGLALYDEKIKALIAASGMSGDDVKSVIAEVVGSLPDDATQDTIIDYLNAKIEAVDGKIGEIDSLKDSLGDTITNLATAIGAELARASTAEKDLSDRLDDLEGIDHLTEDDVKDIASDVLTAALVPEGAKESLDTLEEIAAWIQAHPDDAAAMNADIAALKEAVGEKAVAGTEVITGYKKGDEEAITPEAYEALDEEAKAEYVAVTETQGGKEATGIQNRLNILEQMAGVSDGSTGSTLAERLEALESVKYVAITTDEINALFADPEPEPEPQD